MKWGGLHTPDLPPSQNMFDSFLAGDYLVDFVKNKKIKKLKQDHTGKQCMLLIFLILWH